MKRSSCGAIPALLIDYSLKKLFRAYGHIIPAFRVEQIGHFSRPFVYFATKAMPTLKVMPRIHSPEAVVRSRRADRDIPQPPVLRDLPGTKADFLQKFLTASLNGRAVCRRTAGCRTAVGILSGICACHILKSALEQK
jgi:hypothetical protein